MNYLFVWIWQYQESETKTCRESQRQKYKPNTLGFLFLAVQKKNPFCQLYNLSFLHLHQTYRLPETRHFCFQRTWSIIEKLLQICENMNLWLLYILEYIQKLPKAVLTLDLSLIFKNLRKSGIVPFRHDQRDFVWTLHKNKEDWENTSK